MTARKNKTPQVCSPSPPPDTTRCAVATTLGVLTHSSSASATCGTGDVRITYSRLCAAARHAEPTAHILLRDGAPCAEKMMWFMVARNTAIAGAGPSSVPLPETSTTVPLAAGTQPHGMVAAMRLYSSDACFASTPRCSASLSCACSGAARPTPIAAMPRSTTCDEQAAAKSSPRAEGGAWSMLLTNATSHVPKSSRWASSGGRSPDDDDDDVDDAGVGADAAETSTAARTRRTT